MVGRQAGWPELSDEFLLLMELCFAAKTFQVKSNSFTLSLAGMEDEEVDQELSDRLPATVRTVTDLRCALMRQGCWGGASSWGEDCGCLGWDFQGHP